MGDDTEKKVGLVDDIQLFFDKNPNQMVGGCFDIFKRMLILPVSGKKQYSQDRHENN